MGNLFELEDLGAKGKRRRACAILDGTTTESMDFFREPVVGDLIGSGASQEQAIEARLSFLADAHTR